MKGNSQGLLLVALTAVAAILTFSPGQATPSSQSNVTPGDILRRIKIHGIPRTVRQLWAKPKTWDEVIGGIASGKQKWLEVAVALRPGADAGAGTDLHDAMFAALSSNPSGVLRVAEPAFPIVQLCNGRADPLPTFHEAMGEVARVRDTLVEIQDTALADRKALCLASLGEGQANLYRFFEVPVDQLTPKGSE